MSATLWTPDGTRVVGRFTRVELPARHMELLRDFAAFAAHYQFGLHCGICGEDLGGKNAAQDATHVVTCGCRELVAANRAPVA